MPPEEKMSLETGLPPVSVTVIGTGDGVKNDSVAVTPGANTPNLAVTVIGPFLAIVIRFINVFLTSLVGLISAGMLTQELIPADSFGQLIVNCAWLSVAPAGLGAIKDLITIFGKLEGKYPLLTGNV